MPSFAASSRLGSLFITSISSHRLGISPRGFAVTDPFVPAPCNLSNLTVNLVAEHGLPGAVIAPCTIPQTICGPPCHTFRSASHCRFTGPDFHVDLYLCRECLRLMRALAYHKDHTPTQKRLVVHVNQS